MPDAAGSSKSEAVAVRGGTPAEDALVAWGELKFREDTLGRDAEEREWQEEGLFFQRRQWLEWKEGERRYTQTKPDKRKPRPMPVSNYFAKTVNANANQLGAELVKVSATPRTDDQATAQGRGLRGDGERRDGCRNWHPHAESLAGEAYRALGNRYYQGNHRHQRRAGSARRSAPIRARCLECRMLALDKHS